jgi:hypothetical protein
MEHLLIGTPRSKLLLSLLQLGLSLLLPGHALSRSSISATLFDTFWGSEMSQMFGDNKTVVDSATKIHAKLHKRHTALSFHPVGVAMAAGFIGLHHIPCACNPADVLTKHWLYACVRSMLQPLLFWQGDKANVVGQ